MLILVGILVAAASLVANSVSGIVIGIIIFVIGLATSKKPDPVEVAEASKKSQEKTINDVRNEYDNDRFASILRKNITEDEFRYIDDKDFISFNNIKDQTGILILEDRVETIKQKFYYADYNVKYNWKEKEKLAIYLQSIAGSYMTTDKEKVHKCKVVETISVKTEITYYEDKGGHLQSTGYDRSDELFRGYRVYITGKKVKDTSLKEW